nr:TRAP transporter small permease [Virgibacillus halotolerans]
MAFFARLIIAFIALLIVIDIITINFFNYSYPWILEVTEYLLAAFPLLGAAYLLKQDGHIKLDLFLNKLRERKRFFLETINSCIGLIISLIITVSGFFTTWGLYERGVRTESILEVPRFLLIVIIPISFMFLSIQFSKKLLHVFKKIRGTS